MINVKMIAPDGKQTISVVSDAFGANIILDREDGYSSRLTLSVEQGNVFVDKMRSQGWVPWTKRRKM